MDALTTESIMKKLLSQNYGKSINAAVSEINHEILMFEYDRAAEIIEGLRG